MLACLLVGGSYYFFVPNKYQIFATINLAKVSNQPVEQMGDLIEKLKQPSFYNQRVLMACEGIISNHSISSELSFTQRKSSQLIAFTLKHNNIQQGQTCMNELTDFVIVDQNKLADPYLNEQSLKLDRLVSKLKIAEALLDSGKKNAGKGSADSNNGTINLLRWMYDLEVNNLKEEIQVANIKRINKNENRLASLVSPIYNSGTPVNKVSLSATFALSLFVSLVLCVAQVILKTKT